jgi:hypothetical protein
VKVWHTLSCYFVFLLAHNSHIASSQRRPAFVCWGSRLRPSTYQGDIIIVIILGSAEALGLGGCPCSRCAGAGPASPSATGAPPLVPGGLPWHRICIHIAVEGHDNLALHLLDAGGRREKLPGGCSAQPPGPPGDSPGKGLEETDRGVQVLCRSRPTQGRREP